MSELSFQKLWRSASLIGVGIPVPSVDYFLFKFSSSSISFWINSLVSIVFLNESIALLESSKDSINFLIQSRILSNVYLILTPIYLPLA